MSKHYIKKKITTTILQKVVCDLCGRVSPNDEWSDIPYHTQTTCVKVVVEQRGGNSYPDGGWGTYYDIDLCPNCFKDKLVPWLKSQGAKIEQLEWVY